MLSLKEAKRAAQEAFPQATIPKIVFFNDQYVFQAFHDDSLEGFMDVYYCVNAETGKVYGFPLMLEENFEKVLLLFEKEE